MERTCPILVAHGCLYALRRASSNVSHCRQGPGVVSGSATSYREKINFNRGLLKNQNHSELLIKDYVIETQFYCIVSKKFNFKIIKTEFILNQAG